MMIWLRGLSYQILRSTLAILSTLVDIINNIFNGMKIKWLNNSFKIPQL